MTAEFGEDYAALTRRRSAEIHVLGVDFLVRTRDVFKLCFCDVRFISNQVRECVCFWLTQCELCQCCLNQLELNSCCSAQCVLCRMQWAHQVLVVVLLPSCYQLMLCTRQCVHDSRHAAHNGSRKSHVFISYAGFATIPSTFLRKFHRSAQDPRACGIRLLVKGFVCIVEVTSKDVPDPNAHFLLRGRDVLLRDVLPTAALRFVRDRDIHGFEKLDSRGLHQPGPCQEKSQSHRERCWRATKDHTRSGEDLNNPLGCLGELERNTAGATHAVLWSTLQGQQRYKIPQRGAGSDQ